MDVFDLRQQLIRDYADSAEYVTSFLEIAREQVREHLNERLVDGLLWPHPLAQPNLAFEPADSIDDLVDERILHSECRGVFGTHKTPTDVHGRPLRLHRHQAPALRAAQTGPALYIDRRCRLRQESGLRDPNRGAGPPGHPRCCIQAVVVYPMNALHADLTKFLNYGYPDQRALVRFDPYAGHNARPRRDDRPVPTPLSTDEALPRVTGLSPRRRREISGPRCLYSDIAIAPLRREAARSIK